MTIRNTRVRALYPATRQVHITDDVLELSDRSKNSQTMVFSARDAFDIEPINVVLVTDTSSRDNKTHRCSRTMDPSLEELHHDETPAHLPLEKAVLF